MNKFSIILISLLLLSSCTQNQGGKTRAQKSVGTQAEAEAFYEEMNLIMETYPHRSKLYRIQCDNAEDLLDYYHKNGDILDIPVIDFEYLKIFALDEKPANAFYLSEWRGFRSKMVNRLYPKYKFLEEGQWAKTVELWNQVKEEKYVIICSPQKRMGPELLGGEKYKKGYYKGHFGIYNLESKVVECYGEFHALNKYNRPEELKELSLDLRESLWIDLAAMFDFKLKESIEKGTGIPASNIKLNLETI